MYGGVVRHLFASAKINLESIGSGNPSTNRRDGKELGLLR